MFERVALALTCVCLGIALPGCGGQQEGAISTRAALAALREVGFDHFRVTEAVTPSLEGDRGNEAINVSVITTSRLRVVRDLPSTSIRDALSDRWCSEEEVRRVLPAKTSSRPKLAPVGLAIDAQTGAAKPAM
jgi:hypothetical protein